jgi:hypothetical protein
MVCSLSGVWNSELSEGGQHKKQSLSKTIAEKNFETNVRVDHARYDIWSRGALRMHLKRISSEDRAYFGGRHCGTPD